MKYKATEIEILKKNNQETWIIRTIYFNFIKIIISYLYYIDNILLLTNNYIMI